MDPKFQGRKWQTASIVTWRTPRTEEPDGLQSMGLPRAERLTLLNSLRHRYGLHGGGGSLQKISSMDETVNETWIYAYKGISHNEEGNSDTCFCVGEARSHDDE